MASSPPTLSDLLDAVTALLGRRDLSLQEYQNWMAGSSTGGPGSDGNYPLTDSTGFVRLVACPAAIAALAGGNLSFSRGTPTTITPSAAGTTFDLPWSIGPRETLELLRGGVAQWEGADFSVSGTTVTIAGGFDAGEVFRVRKTALNSGV
jgi:hypothetical protein